MTTIILFCGIFSTAFALFHLSFWKIFNWHTELKKLGFANRGIMQILNGQIIYYFLFVAFVCFVFPGELLSGSLGKVFLSGCSLFWLIRTLQQFIFFRIHDFRIHLLTLLFITGTVLFAIPVLMT